MITSKQLSILRQTSLEDVDIQKLPELKDTSIDTNLPIPERIMQYLGKVENPYCFKFEDIRVKIDFADRPVTLQKILTDFLIRKKTNS